MLCEQELKHALFSGVVIGVNGCWIWKHASHNKGYGMVYLNGKRWYTHRLAYTLWKGPIPKGLQVDHLCRNRACCNPEHLEAVTCRENLLRGKTIAAMHAQKTHCKNGHEFTTENTDLSEPGRRRCRACRNFYKVKNSDTRAGISDKVTETDFR